MRETRKYKKGSVIFFEGDERIEDIYVLLEGKVLMKYKNLESLEYVGEFLKAGDFFGVKSALGNHKREETVEVQKDSKLWILKVKEFEDLVSQNVNLGLNMLKGFSTQLRQIGKRVSDLLSETGQEEPDSEDSLYRMGEYYLRHEKYKESWYVLNKYMECFPDGVHFEEAKGKSIKIQDYLVKGKNISKGEGGGDGVEGGVGVGDEDLYEEGMRSIDGDGYEKGYEKGLELLLRLDNLVRGGMELEEGKKERLYYEIGRCFWEGKNYDGVVQRLTYLIKMYPKTKYMRSALFYLGSGLKELGDKVRAKSFFNKLLLLEVDEGMERDIRDLLKDL